MPAVLVSLLSLLPISAYAQTADFDADEIALLKQHRITPSAAGLLEFFRARTLTEEKIRRVGELMQLLGHARFQVRDSAAKELLTMSVPVLKYLEPALRNPDQEIADRARRIGNEIRSGPGPSLPIAAVRQLRKHRVAEAVAVLLAYLPFADDPTVEDEALVSLAQLGVRDGQADPLLRQAATDRVAARRAAAGFVLGRSRADTDRAAARPLLRDSDAWARLRAAQGLIAGRDKAAVPPLIALLNCPQIEVAWRAEELLRRIAGERSPNSASGAGQVDEQEWLAWWVKAGKEIDLAQLPNEPAVLGLWLGIEFNTNSVWECGRDGKRRWTVHAEGPMDAQVLPGNRILIAEQNAKRVTERDMKGNILWQFDTDGEAQNCQRLRNGNTFIATRTDVMEVRPNKTVVFKYQMTNAYLHGVRRMPNGHFVGIGASGGIIEMSPAGKVVRQVALAHEGTWGDVVSLPGGHFMVTNYGSGFVREVDAAGKTLREVKITDACGLDVLPNGKILVSGTSYAMMTDWSGKSLWKTSSDGCVRRVHLR
jgi:hypothetical protein